MLTMTTSTTECISPQRPSNQTTIDKSSLTLKESTAADLSICCLNNKSYNPTQVLRTIPTGINPHATHNANAVNAIVTVDPAVDDDNQDPNERQTFLKEWDAFYNDFVQSSTYTRAHSSAKSNLSSLADAPVQSTKNTEPQLTNGRSQSIPQLLQVLGELEQLNDQLFQLIAVQNSLAPCLPSPKTIDNNPPQPRLCPAPTFESTQQHVSPCATPSAPNPAAIPLPQLTQPPATQSARLTCIHGSMQPYPEPQPERAPQHVPLQELPPAPDPTNQPLQTPTQQHASQFERNMCIDSIPVHCISPSPPTRPCGPQTNPKTAIPTWAKPAVAVPSPAIPMEGVVSPPWPPPRPNMKTTPHKKKSPAKHTVTQRSRDKDFLRPP